MSILALILRLFGFFESAANLMQMIQEKNKARDVASTPDTDKEWEDAAKKNDL